MITSHLSSELKAKWGLENPATVEYYGRVVRIAALCHDLGHLPFSHGIEELLGKKDHEDLSKELIQSPEVSEILRQSQPPINVTDVVKLALEKEKVKDLNPKPWEEILNLVITGECFGADRMDYLLRDSYHLGVSHGHFDHHRLIECLRILPLPPTPEGEVSTYSLGIEQGGLRSAEALLLARYMMFSQIYHHKTRIIFDHHLREFMGQWIRREEKTVESLLDSTDNEVFVALEKARRDKQDPGHAAARCLLDRQHFRLLYQRNPADDQLNAEAFSIVATSLKKEFGDEAIVIYTKDKKKPEKIAEDLNFPVSQPGSSETVSSLSLSQILQVLPQPNYAYLYGPSQIRESVSQWLKTHKNDLLSSKPKEE